MMKTLINKKRIKFWAIALMSVFALVAVQNISAMAAKGKGDLGVAKKDRTVTLTLGKAQTLDFKAPISDLLIGNPSLVDAGALQHNKIYLVGTALGDTNILVFGANGRTVESINVHVRVDDATLQDTIDSFFPNENITVKAVNDDLILAGEVSNTSVANSARDIADRFLGGQEGIVNLMTIAEEQQVTIKVKVVEISREILNELSTDLEIDTDGVFENAFTAGPLGGGGNLSIGGTSAAATQLTSTAGLSELALSGTPDNFPPISLLLDALEQDNLAKILAEPNLTAKSGENARFIAGGQVPVVSNVNANGLVTFEYQPFGVVLAFRPVVLSENQISLTVSTEVSEVSTALGTAVSGIPFPSFEVRRAETVVELPSGGSLMMAGLIESETISNISGLPGIEETPILGELVKSDSFARDETELIIMISAYLSEPFSDEEDVEIVNVQDKIEERYDSLSRAFAANIIRTYGEDAPGIVNDEHKIGYLIE